WTNAIRTPPPFVQKKLPPQARKERTRCDNANTPEVDAPFRPHGTGLKDAWSHICALSRFSGRLNERRSLFPLGFGENQVEQDADDGRQSHPLHLKVNSRKFQGGAADS